MLLYDSSHISEGKCRRDRGELFDKTLFETNFITGEPVYPLLQYHLGARYLQEYGFCCAKLGPWVHGVSVFISRGFQYFDLQQAKCEAVAYAKS